MIPALDALRSALRFSKKIIIVSLTSVTVFSAVMIYLYVTTGAVPDTLVSEFIGFFRLEGGVLGLIKVAETIADKAFGGSGRKQSSDSGDGLETLDGDYPELTIHRLGEEPEGDETSEK